MTRENSSGLKPPNGAGNSPSLSDRLLWLCPIVGLLAGVVIVWLFGFTLWTALAFVFMIACPSTVAWVLLIERRQNPIARKKP